MTTSISVQLYLLLISNLLLVSAVGLAVVRFLRRCNEIERFWASPTGTALKNDEHPRIAYLQLAERLEKRVDDMHRIVTIMAANDSSNKSLEQANAQLATVLPLENAVRMAKQGASVEDLTRSCGLNIGEARLMRKLHGNRLTSAG